MNMYEKIETMDKRMTNIENTLDLIAKNHLSHIEKYTKWTLVGIVVSTLLSLLAVASTVL